MTTEATSPDSDWIDDHEFEAEIALADQLADDDVIDIGRLDYGIERLLLGDDESISMSPSRPPFRFSRVKNQPDEVMGDHFYVFDSHANGPPIGLVAFGFNETHRTKACDARYTCLAWARITDAISMDLCTSLLSEGMFDDPMPRVTVLIRQPYDIQGDTGHVLTELLSYSGKKAIMLWINDEHLRKPCGRCISCNSISDSRSLDSATWVYFIQAGRSGPVKIGFSNNVDSRIASFQTGHHEELRLIAKVPGGSLLERAVHQAMAQHRIRGEWFAPSQELFDLIAEMRGR